MADGPDGYEVDCSALSPEEWTEVLAGFGDATLYQSWSYGAVRWGPGRLRHVVVRRDGVPVAAAQAAVFALPVLGFGAAYASWGPLTRPRDKRGGERPGRLRAALRALAKLDGGGVLGGRLSVRLRPGLLEDDRAAREALEREGFRPMADRRPYETILMDLSPSLEDLRRGMRHSWRRGLARAERAGLESSEGTGPELWRAFARLYDEMKGRKGFDSTVSVPEMERVQASLPEELKLRLVVCSLDGEPASALVYSAIGDTAVTILSAASSLGRKTYASFLARWRVVQALKASGLSALDQGGVDFERSPGPAGFKQGFAGRNGRIVRHIGQYESGGSAASRLALKAGSLFQRIWH